MVALCMAFILSLVAQATPPDATQPATRDLYRDSVGAPAGSGRRVAVIIGVKEYSPSSGISSLEFPIMDAHGVARALIESGSFASADVIVMTTEESGDLVPTANNIRTRLDSLREQRNIDLLFVYFSGHGTAGSQNGKKQNYILPYDASVRMPEATGISVDELLARTNAVNAGARLMVLDACRSAPDGTRSLRSPGFSPENYAVAGAAVVFAAKFGEPAYEDRSLRHGVFTAFLIDGLRGAADGWGGLPRDGVVTLREVYGYTKERLAEIPRDPVPQSPWISLEDWNGGEFPITEVYGDVAEGPCPSGRRDLDRALDAAVEACDTELRDSFRFAWSSARRVLLCMVEPVTPAQATRWHQLDTLYQLGVRDRAAAARAWRSSIEVALREGIRSDLPVPCMPDEALRERARLLSLEQLAVPEVPALAELHVGGAPSATLLGNLPNLVQLTWDRSLAEPPQIWAPGLPLPVFADVTPPHAYLQRRRARFLAAGSGGAALAAGGLLGAGLIAEDSWRSLMDYCYYDEDSGDPETCADRGEGELRRRANILGASAGVTGAVSLGLGAMAVGVRGDW